MHGWLNSEASLFLEELLRQSLLGSGRTHPNPTVAALAFDSDHPELWTSGATEPPGKRHAEIVALDSFRKKFQKDPDSLIVTLEPCSVSGRTPPCVDRILATSGLSNIYIGGLDPSLSRQGVQKLEKAGRNVIVADAEGLRRWSDRPELSSFLSGLSRLYGLFPGSFVHRLQFGRPRLVLKAASDGDGLMGDKKQRLGISGAEGLHAGQLLRRTMDAIIVGPGTVLIDEPSLDWRPRMPGQAMKVAQSKNTIVTAHGDETGLRFAAPGEKNGSREVRSTEQSDAGGPSVAPVHHLRASDPFLESLLHYGDSPEMRAPDFDHQPVRIFLLPHPKTEKKGRKIQDFVNRQRQRAKLGGPEPVFWTVGANYGSGGVAERSGHGKGHPDVDSDLPSLKDPMFGSELLQGLCSLGLNTVLVEGGAGLHDSLRWILWPDDRFYWLKRKTPLSGQPLEHPVFLPEYLKHLPRLQTVDLGEDELISFAGRA
ncbi:MAG: hypothetical protein KDK23_04065 [Leptospiraceae bacterium]|nr:hypothetical protein [Leptospiraceae bacterium]